MARPRKGKGTKIRWAVLAAGSTARPSSLALITGVQTSEIKGTQEMDDAPDTDYESATDPWRDGDSVKQLGWTMSLSAHELEDTAQAAQLVALWNAWAARQPIWIERLKPGATKWKGGRAIIQDPTEPVPNDGEIPFSCNLLGQGAIIETPDAP